MAEHYAETSDSRRSKARRSASGEIIMVIIVPLNKAKSQVLLLQSVRTSQWYLPATTWRESEGSPHESARRVAWKGAGISDIEHLREVGDEVFPGQKSSKYCYRFFEVTVTKLRENDWPNQLATTRKWTSYDHARIFPEIDSFDDVTTRHDCPNPIPSLNEIAISQSDGRVTKDGGVSLGQVSFLEERMKRSPFFPEGVLSQSDDTRSQITHDSGVSLGRKSLLKISLQTPFIDEGISTQYHDLPSWVTNDRSVPFGGPFNATAVQFEDIFPERIQHNLHDGMRSLNLGNRSLVLVSDIGKTTEKWKKNDNLQGPGQSKGKEKELAISNVSSHTLQKTLVAGDSEEVKVLLEKHFNAIAEEEFVWLQELRDHGYTIDEIADLLLTEQRDSPWIYFEPNDIPSYSVDGDYHQPFCVHSGGQEIRGSTKLIPPTEIETVADDRPSSSPNEALVQIQELCGIAGIIPNTRGPEGRANSVVFSDEVNRLGASVSYYRPSHGPVSRSSSGSYSGPYGAFSENPSAGLHTASNSPESEDFDFVLRALGNLLRAIVIAQRSGICCSLFTILICLHTQVTSRGSDVIELRQIKLDWVLDLHQEISVYVRRVGKGKLGELDPSIHFDRAVRTLLNLKAVLNLNWGKVQTSQGLLDQSSSMVQLLCVAFLSYVNSHIGPMQPFFLDTPLSTIEFFGSRNCSNDTPHARAFLCRFSCLDAMIQDPVLVFGDASWEEATGMRYHLQTTVIDLLDTWGPGQLVMSPKSAKMDALSSVLIGGGFITPTSEDGIILHWSKNVKSQHDFDATFSAYDKVLIAGGVTINGTCKTNPTERWSSFRGSLENLSTSADYWQFTEFQAGLAVAGQQFAGGQLQFNKTWTWHPGNSWKRQYLSLLAEELPFSELDRPWGLQVSACTGVARRVPLRSLLADTMSVFAVNLGLPPVWSVLQQQGIIQALEIGGQHLVKWYNDLSSLPQSEELQILTKRLIRYILLVLRDTGIDRDHKTFLIACPQDHAVGMPITMCLPVPCENASLWAKILEDTEECATFACMTKLCFESQEHKCQQTHQWECPSLDTAVQQSRPRREPILLAPQAWDLEVNKLYWIGMPHSGLQARVALPPNSPNSSFPRLYISKSSIPQKTRARLGAMGKMMLGPNRDRLKERQIDTWPAKDVLILSQPK